MKRLKDTYHISFNLNFVFEDMKTIFGGEDD